MRDPGFAFGVHPETKRLPLTDDEKDKEGKEETDNKEDDNQQSE